MHTPPHSTEAPDPWSLVSGLALLALIIKMDEERLITEVRSYPELYDPQSRHYKNNTKKESAWRAIASELGLSGNLFF